MIIRAAAIALALVVARPDALIAAPRQLVFSSSSENDLYKAIAAGGQSYMRRETPAAAIDAAPEGSAVLILADEYPAKRAQVPLELYARARSKRLRLYVEYPSHLLEIEPGATQRASWSRGVVSSNAFGAALPRLRILGLHDCRFLPITLPS